MVSTNGFKINSTLLKSQLLDTDYKIMILFDTIEGMKQ